MEAHHLLYKSLSLIELLLSEFHPGARGPAAASWQFFLPGPSQNSSTAVVCRNDQEWKTPRFHHMSRPQMLV